MSNTLNIQGKELKLDKHGYLQKLSDWNQTVADALALKEGLSLTSDHWALMNLLRNFHQQSGLIPSTRVLVKLIAKELGEEKGKSIYLMSLFPGTPLKSICKIAGLPRPINCV
ncbi:MAG: sulfurtransferase TusE [SAR86 cluster bacterium]|uniref:Sulfurtransferase n=1 Tax=SAR86 cluster bacterium TaxID=2030880 RepID=A0A2A5CE78_9GAMM|nr:TusE/DsrC/DsvC family sulfur relay protein [Gammaproteobacteria bacterium AH-315-E17]PCJ42072.1 MAG: sulfurtransferase TusE [SAR86 cluster bacterium]